MPAPPVGHLYSATRLVNVIVDPKAAFRGIATDSPWLLAFLAIIAVRFAGLFAFYHPTVTPFKLLGSLAFQVVSTLPLLLVSAALVWVAAWAMRVALAWSTSFSIATHIHFAYTLATTAIASVAGALLPESADVDVRNPPFTNLATLVAASSHPFVARLVAEADVRGVYVLVLLWLALRAASPDVPGRRIAAAMGAIATVRLVGVVTAFLL